MLYTSLKRALAVGLAVVVCFGAWMVREATSPSGLGFWTAMAVAPSGGVYLADEPKRELVLLREGKATVAARLPAAIYRGLAADESLLLLGTESGLYVSNDSGANWRNAIPGHFTAVAVTHPYADSPAVALAGAWGGGLWRSTDAGQSWSQAEIPAGDNEFEAIDSGFFLVGTLLGVLASSDGGRSWWHIAWLPDRVTAVEGGLIGDWRGDVYAGSSKRLLRAGAGIWSISAAYVATTRGLRHLGGGEDFRGREVTRVVSASDRVYAAIARDGVYWLDPSGRWSLVYQP